MRRRQMRKRKINVVFLVSLAVFLVAAVQFVRIGKGYLDGRKEYKELQNLAVHEPEKKKGEKPKIQVDFDKLLKVNGDTVGWLHFEPEPKIIDYPVVQGKDNEEYLHKTFSAKENTLGAIFLSVENQKDFSDRHSVIYGHRMRDGSMFRHLQDYDRKAFWKKNQRFYLYTLDGRELTYRIYMAGEILDTSKTYRTEFADDKEFEEFLKQTKEEAFYDTGLLPDVDSQIVTLSTCTGASDHHRIVVRGYKEKELLVTGE